MNLKNNRIEIFINENTQINSIFLILIDLAYYYYVNKRQNQINIATDIKKIFDFANKKINVK